MRRDDGRSCPPQRCTKAGSTKPVPDATHPCPICIISDKSFTKSSRYRTLADKHSLHPEHSALLTIDPECIVPTSLHLFLGISNRIILDTFSALFSKKLVEETLEKVKRFILLDAAGRVICSNSTGRRFASGSRKVAHPHSVHLLRRRERSPRIKSPHTQP